MLKMLELSDKDLDTCYSNASTSKAKISSKECTPMSTKRMICAMSVQSGTWMMLCYLGPQCLW